MNRIQQMYSGVPLFRTNLEQTLIDLVGIRNTQILLIIFNVNFDLLSVKLSVVTSHR